MTDAERRAWLDEEERKRLEDEHEEEMARQKERELKERLKQKAREKRKEKERLAEAQREKERQAAAEEQKRRDREREEEATKRKAAEEAASRPPPITIDPATARARSESAATDSPLSGKSTTSESLTYSATSSIPTAVNPALTLPTSTPSFTAAPSFTLPAIPFSAIDHFTLTHIQNLLAQMWTIALSLLSSTPIKTAAWYDNHHPACLHCHQRFGLVHRRHHCRLCGGLYCGACSGHKVTIEKFGFKNVRVCNTCLTSDHMVMTRSGWRWLVDIYQEIEGTRIKIKEAELKIAEGEPGIVLPVMPVIDVLSLNRTTSAVEWKPVSAAQRFKQGRQDQRLYRMQGEGMDVVATADHRMLTATRRPHGPLQSGSLDFHTVEELAGLQYAAARNSKVTAFAHSDRHVVVRSGTNRQPPYIFDIAGMSAICALWRDRDLQRGFLRFVGFWLGDGGLMVNQFKTLLSQRKLAGMAWLVDLLDEVFPYWWYRNPTATDGKGITFQFSIRCPPLYAWLLVMAVGPAGYNPLSRPQLRMYPHFDYDDDVVKAEAASKYKPRGERRTDWTEADMLAALKRGPRRRACVVCKSEDQDGARVTCSGRRCQPVDDITRAHARCVGREEKVAFCRPKGNKTEAWPWYCPQRVCQREQREWDTAYPFVPPPAPPLSAKSSKSSKSPEAAKDPKAEKDEEEEAEENDQVCVACGGGDSIEGNELLLCDGCDRGGHQVCVDIPVLPPEGVGWYCDNCAELAPSAIAPPSAAPLLLQQRPASEDDRSSKRRHSDAANLIFNSTVTPHVQACDVCLETRAAAVPMRDCNSCGKSFDHMDCTHTVSMAGNWQCSHCDVWLDGGGGGGVAQTQTAPAAAAPAAPMVATGVIFNGGVFDIDADGNWFHRKRWMGPNALVASTFANLSQPQAVALLEGFNLADGRWDRTLFNKDGSPQGTWQCTHSSMPLIHHLQLIAQLAGARCDLARHSEQGKKSTGFEGRVAVCAVDHWQLSMRFEGPCGARDLVVAQLAQPVDVSADIDKRGYYEHEDDGFVYDLTVPGNENFLTQRMSLKRIGSRRGKDVKVEVRGHPVFVGNCFVMARTVVLCRKAVESGQVEYKEVVRQAERYAEGEREKARAAQLKLMQGGVVKSEKQITVVETPRGSTTLAQITPPMSPELQAALAAGTAESAVDALRTPPKKKEKKDAPISPALVPFFAGSPKDKDKDKEKEKEAAASSPVATIAEEPAAAVSAAAVADQHEREERHQRMLKLIDVEREKQKRLQKESDAAALPPAHPSSAVGVRRLSASSSAASSAAPSAATSATPSAASSQASSPALSAVAAPKAPKKIVKSLGLGTKAIL